MKLRIVALQSVIFTTQWALMVIGFGLISLLIVPHDILTGTGLIHRYLNAGLKAVLGLILSMIWLYIWDRQVRIFFYRG